MNLGAGSVIPRVGKCGGGLVVALVVLSALQACGAQPAKSMPPAVRVDGERAMQHVRRVVAFGPRTSGSPAIESLRGYLRAELTKVGIKVEEQAFSAKTPAGPVPMVNVIAKIPGNTGRRVLITGHYDTKRMVGMRFVGANDAGSSTALLLELATVLARRASEQTAGRQASPRDEIWLVFFDGEEAFADWTETDSLYGSRHLASELEKDGQIRSIRALVNLDMIGDRDLRLTLEYNSTAALRELAMEVARAQGHRDLFEGYLAAIEDDHIPFARRGVPVLNLIDFSYGPEHGYWHTEEDTIDKLAPSSFQVVGDLVLGIVERLAR
jgi:Zn-dependent M28 family amino/carboxypeptidase